MSRRTDWSGLVKPSLVGVAPYDPGETLSELRERYGLGEVAKLNWNEGLFGPIPGALEAAAAELENAWTYPEQAYADFRETLASWLGVRATQVVPSHGIQSLVTSVAAAFVTPGAHAVVPRPTYGLYAQVLTAAGATVEHVPVRGDLVVDLEALAAAARRTHARLAVVVDPNNPTGTVAAEAEWRAFLDALPEGCVAVVDEAYVDHVDAEIRVRREDDVQAGRPVVLLRTFSKLFGLAGLRLGYAVADEELAGFLHVVQEPFNVNRVALAAGRASLLPEAIEARRVDVAAARGLLAALLEEQGVRVVPSQANFVLVEVGGDDLAVTEGLLRRGLLVRPGSDFGMPGFLRITVAPAPVMRRVAEAVREVRGAQACG